MTLGSGRVRLVRYSSLLMMCCNCRLMNTHPRNLDICGMIKNRPVIESPMKKRQYLCKGLTSS